MDHVTNLHAAIKDGIVPDFAAYKIKMGKKTLLDTVMATNRHGDTPFILGARHGHVTILTSLHADYGVGLNHANADGKTALHEAAQNGHSDCVDYLIQAGCCIDPLKRADWTPLMLACTKGNLHIVKTLIENGAMMDLRNKDGWTPFHISSRQGNTDVLKYLLTKDPYCHDTCSNNRRTPLHTAALNGQLDASALILKISPPSAINARDSCGVTPLMDAVRGNHLAIAKLLIDHGADVHMEDGLERQCSHIASQAGSCDTLDLVLSLGNDVNRTASISCITPLHYAAKEGQSDAISTLLQNGADVNITDKNGRTALDIAKTARNGAEAVKILEQYLAAREIIPF